MIDFKEFNSVLEDVSFEEIDEGIIKAIKLNYHANQYQKHKEIAASSTSSDRQKIKAKTKMAMHRTAILHHTGIE